MHGLTLPPAYEVRVKVMFILGIVCLSTQGEVTTIQADGGGGGGTPSQDSGYPIQPDGGYPHRKISRQEICFVKGKQLR